MSNQIYKKSFIFEADRFEEFRDGKCTNQGACSITLIAKVINDDCIGMVIQGNIPVKINDHFGLPILGVQGGDVLKDRVQYGRIPGNMSWSDSNEPVVCNIFNNMTCVRFAMMSPLRIVEFHGNFTDIRDL